MLGKPGFIHRQDKKITDPNAVGNIHEAPAQLVQGGSPGQHYHLTAAQHLWAQKQYEPLMIQGELVTLTSGDLLLGTPFAS